MAGTLRTKSVLDQICDYGVIPVVVADDPEQARPLGIALRAGGLPVAEVTFRTERAADALRILAVNPEMLVGAGTVVAADQVDLAYEAGARFIVTPGFSRPVIERCRQLELPVIPGIATPSDIIAALDQGIRLVKFFPAESLGGVSMLRALHGPFPNVRFIPTGGINATTYLRERSVAAVGGSWMVAPEHVRGADFDAITRLTAQAIQIAGEARA
jgi:2-dehydro-3-deoxyphosphogluconate aldolase/(4S)-4-hydroxy-2-oxoglutarate aldolase